MKVGFDTPLLAARQAAGTGSIGTGAAGAIGAAGAAAGKASGAGFSQALNDALGSVSRLQNESSQLQRQFQAGNAGVSLEQTMVAMQQSQVAFQAAVTVRNRLVSAYSEIMNMQV